MRRRKQKIMLSGSSPKTLIPDANFEQALIDLGHSSAPVKGWVYTSQINTITYLDVRFKNISDLTGIEDFAALVYFNCSYNQITTLDVTQNTALTFLSCSSNQITTLDVTQNTALERLYCAENQLTSLNIANGNNTNLLEFNATSNPSLTCIQVDDAAYMNANWSNAKDATAIYSENCSEPKTLIPDANFEQALIDLGHSAAPIKGWVYTSQINTITYLDVRIKNISDLTGIEDFVALEVVNCRENHLTSLDLSQNNALERLYCYDNNLTSLDLSQNNALERLYCYDNNLTSLNIANGNNINLTGFNATNNLNLLCIQVDDHAYMNANWSDSKDATSRYSEDCSLPFTLIPDANFEQALIDLGHSVAPIKGWVYTSQINTITYLEVNNQSISDLTGIEDFLALENLSCDNNQLTTLDVSQNLALEIIICYSNQLTSLNIANGNNTNLTGFNATDNQNLNEIYVDDAAYMNANWSNAKDATATYITI